MSRMVRFHCIYILFRAREALRQCLPEQLKDSTFAVSLKDDSTTKKWLSQLLQNLGLEAQAGSSNSSGGSESKGTGANTNSHQ